MPNRQLRNSKLNKLNKLMSSMPNRQLRKARTDTKIWHDVIFPHAKVEFIKGRLKFSNSKNSAPFPSAIVIFYGAKQ